MVHYHVKLVIVREVQAYLLPKTGLYRESNHELNFGFFISHHMQMRKACGNFLECLFGNP